MDKKRALVGSLIYQKPEILESFLKSLKNLYGHTISIDSSVANNSYNQPKFKNQQKHIFVDF